MSDQPVVDSASLYEAARNEAPSPESTERARDSLLRALRTSEKESLRKFSEQCATPESSTRSVARVIPLRLAVPLAAAAAATLWLLAHDASNSRSPVELKPEPIAEQRSEPLRQAPSATSTTSPTTPPRTETPATTKHLPPPNVKPAQPSAPSLTTEVALLDRARASLERGDSGQALRVLDEYESELHGVHMRAEATLLRITALSRAGRDSESRELADRFIAESPNNPLALRAQQIVNSSDRDQDSDKPSDRP